MNIHETEGNSLTVVLPELEINRKLDGMAGASDLGPRKSLGWINVMRDTDESILVDSRLSPSREHADLCARIALHANPPDTLRRKILACIEIFEGDGI
mgnify:CR=1 FL=1